MTDLSARHRASALLPALPLLVFAIFAPAAPAQQPQQVGAIGAIGGSLGGIERSVHAGAGGQSRPASSGGSAPAAGSSTGSSWSTKAGGAPRAQSGAIAGGTVGGWSPGRNGARSVSSRPSVGNSLEREPGGKPDVARPESASKKKKRKDGKGLPAVGGMATPETTRSPFGFTGKVRGFSGGGRGTRKTATNRGSSAGRSSKRRPLMAKDKSGRILSSSRIRAGAPRK